MRFLFRKPAPTQPTPEPVKKAAKPCPVCQLVASAGRSGEKKLKFKNGEKATVEIINQKGVPGRECYTLCMFRYPGVGEVEVPIRYCPWCSRRLGGK